MSVMSAAGDEWWEKSSQRLRQLKRRPPVPPPPLRASRRPVRGKPVVLPPATARRHAGGASLASGGSAKDHRACSSSDPGAQWHTPTTCDSALSWLDAAAHAEAKGVRASIVDPAVAPKTSRELLEETDLVKRLCSRMKAAAYTCGGENWAKLFREQDKDHSGEINWDEFYSMCRRVLKLNDKESHLRLVFRSLDPDRSGQVSIDELVLLVKDPIDRMRCHLRTAVSARYSNDWPRFLREQDADGSGSISWTEFRAMCRDRLKLLDSDVQLNMIFRTINSDASGELSLVELVQFAQEGSEEDRSLNAAVFGNNEGSQPGHQRGGEGTALPPPTPPRSAPPSSRAARAKAAARADTSLALTAAKLLAGPRNAPAPHLRGVYDALQGSRPGTSAGAQMVARSGTTRTQSEGGSLSTTLPPATSPGLMVTAICQTQTSPSSAPVPSDDGEQTQPLPQKEREHPQSDANGALPATPMPSQWEVSSSHGGASSSRGRHSHSGGASQTGASSQGLLDIANNWRGTTNPGGSKRSSNCSSRTTSHEHAVVCELAQSCWKGQEDNTRWQALATRHLVKEWQLHSQFHVNTSHVNRRETTARERLGAPTNVVRQSVMTSPTPSTGSDQASTTSSPRLSRWGSKSPDVSQRSRVQVAEAPEEAKGLGKTGSERHADAPTEELTVFEAYALAERFNLPAGQVTKAWKLFKRYDVHNHGALTNIEFQLLLRSVLRERFPSAKDVPRELFNPTKDESVDSLDFIDFLTWVTQNCFSELLLLNNAQRTIRQIARKFKKPVPEVEAIKAQFDKFDEDRSGKVEYNEFACLLCVLLGIKDKSTLPQSRIRSFWRELDSDASGFVDFSEFIPWYVNYFDSSNPSGVSPLEDFYRNIRPVPFNFSAFD